SRAGQKWDTNHACLQALHALPRLGPAARDQGAAGKDLDRPRYRRYLPRSEAQRHGDRLGMRQYVVMLRTTRALHGRQCSPARTKLNNSRRKSGLGSISGRARSSDDRRTPMNAAPNAVRERRHAPLTTPSDLGAEAVRDIGGALTLLLAD